MRGQKRTFWVYGDVLYLYCDSGKIGVDIYLNSLNYAFKVGAFYLSKLHLNQGDV